MQAYQSKTILKMSFYDYHKIEEEEDIQNFQICFNPNCPERIGKQQITPILQDQAFIIDNFLSSEECQKLRVNIDKGLIDVKRDPSTVIHRFRNAQTVEVPQVRVGCGLWNRLKELIVASSLTYAICNGKSLEGLNDCLLFIRYPPDGYFAPHVDGPIKMNEKSVSEYTIIIYLNTIPSEYGGQTRFYDGNKGSKLEIKDTRFLLDPSLRMGDVEAVEGRLLMFRHHLTHESVLSTYPSSLKYILRSDLFLSNSKLTH